MEKPFYIFSNGRIRRKDNTVFFEYGDSNDESQEEKESKPANRRAVPVETIDSIYLFGEVDLNNKVINFLGQNHIPIHFFNYYGYYTGTFYPREYAVSGHILVKQVSHYVDPGLRFAIAQEIIQSSNHNILKNLKYYERRYGDLSGFISHIENKNREMGSSRSIEELMGFEGQIHKRYFEAWNKILKSETFLFDKRTRMPPDNPINALISFGNSMVYATALSEIYKTQLNPAISYLHQPSTKRFSLSLDLAEIFKPLLVDRLIFSMINHNQIRENHFESNLEFCYLNEKGRRTFTEQFDEKLKTTVKHPSLKRNVSYRQLIKLECYKLVKHILGEEEFKGFRMWW
ncbi:MAG TPA: type I-B CRISPR-associated endonuclease Cas1b [Thermodesulfobacteriota bacterium]|nr:type I-B CRISPR-associated endonuclease Cas1b [Thermodesulfobacteriota bacterium]